MVRTAATGSGTTPVVPEGEILLDWDDLEVPGEGIRGVLVSDRVDRRAMEARLRHVAQTASHIHRVSDRMQVSVDLLLAALDSIAAGEPVRDLADGTQLSERDVEVLVEAGVTTEQDPPAVARSASRAAMRYARLVQTSRTVADAARLLEVSQARIRQRIAARTLYAFQGPKGWLLPDFQFTSYGPLHGIDVVLAALPGGLHPISVDGFFRRPDPDLDTGSGAMSIVQWLASGGPPEPAVELARDLLTSP